MYYQNALSVAPNSPASFSVATLPLNILDNYALFWGKNGNTKTASVLKVIHNNPGITTDNVRYIASCSNVPDLVHAINKKIMNFGLMIVRIEPVGVPSNAAFHHWYLVYAPVMNISVSMAVNDPL